MFLVKIFNSNIFLIALFFDFKRNWLKSKGRFLTVTIVKPHVRLCKKFCECVCGCLCKCVYIHMNVCV